MRFSESKVECNASFGGSFVGPFLHGPFPGVLHLFEAAYENRVTFWGGIVEAAWNATDCVCALNASPSHQLFAFVQLTDGRQGLAYVMDMRGSEGVVLAADGDDALPIPNLTCAVAGLTALANPDAAGNLSPEMMQKLLGDAPRPEGDKDSAS